MTDSSAELRGAAGAVRAAIDRFTGSVEQHKLLVDLTNGDDPRTGNAVRWLMAVRNSDGYWGYRSPAITATSVIAINAWDTAGAHLNLRSSAEWLQDQAVDGCWETWWDTGAALQALAALGFTHTAVSQRALDQTLATDPVDLRVGAHHMAQVLGALDAVGADRSFRDRWAEATIASLDAQAGPYVVGQALFALLSHGVPSDEFPSQTEELARYLRTTPLSTSALLDHAAALRAVAAARTFPDVVDETVDGLFSSAYRSDGSWYHDPWYTNWALLALREATGVGRFVVEQPAMHSYLSDLRTAPIQVEDSERSRSRQEYRNRWNLLGAALLVQFAAAGLVAALTVLPEDNRLFSSGLAITCVISLLALGWRFLWPLLRPPPR
jgi:hypothetical protein